MGARSSIDLGSYFLHYRFCGSNFNEFRFNGFVDACLPPYTIMPADRCRSDWRFIVIVFAALILVFVCVVAAIVFLSLPRCRCSKLGVFRDADRMDKTQKPFAKPVSKLRQAIVEIFLNSLFMFLLKMSSNNVFVHQKVDATEACVFSRNGVVIKRLVCVSRESLVLRGESAFQILGTKIFSIFIFFCLKNEMSFASDFDPTVCDKTKSCLFNEKNYDDPPHPQYNVDRRFAREAESPEEIAFFTPTLYWGCGGSYNFLCSEKKPRVYEKTAGQKRGIFWPPNFRVVTIFFRSDYIMCVCIKNVRVL